MEKFHKSQCVKILLIAVLVLILPLISTSLRAPYLYLLLNLLIITLGAESGALAAISKPHDEKKPIVSVPSVAAEGFNVSNDSERSAKTAQKPAVEKIDAVVRAKRVKKCPSTPSLFFIGGSEAEEVEDEVYEEEEEVGDVNGQELFTKAETFIGNFYKQLKIQREDSWKRIHGLYHKAF